MSEQIKRYEGTCQVDGEKLQGSFMLPVEVACALAAKDARIAELERVLHESSQYLDGNKLNQIASGSKLHCMMRGVVSGMHPATPSEDGRRVLEGWRLANELKKQFPLLDDNGLCEVEHHCEWSIQQDRKRLHALLDAQPARQVRR